ncbi:MAG: glycosyltransferase [Planctomycetota bacterium]
MRALMLGWEFPPHISGGLGTACKGLVEGLGHHGVETLFVMPRAIGGDTGARTRVMGCNQVEVEVPCHDETATTTVPRADSVCYLPMDTPLTPYLTPASYRSELARSNRDLVGDCVPLPYFAGEWREAMHALADSCRDVPLRTRLAFAGGYGPDLYAEVLRYARVVCEIARREEFDLVHAHDWMTFPAAVAAARLARKPLIVHVHATEYDRSGEQVNERVRQIEQFGLEAAHRIVCVSHFTARLLKTRYSVEEAKLRVVHNAVSSAADSSEPKPQPRETTTAEAELPLVPKRPLVLFLGRITFQKGPDYFLAAARRVIETRPDVQFVMAGNGDMLPAMIEESARLGLERHVHFTGFLRGADVHRMYRQADLYVMPSVSEPFGIAPLEALQQEVPVIVSRQSGVSETLRHALKVDFWDVDELANKILATLSYPILRETLGRDGSREASQMRWEDRGAVLRTVYEELHAEQFGAASIPSASNKEAVR